MANDSETLTFRIRAIAENLGVFRRTASESDKVNRSMKDAANLSDKLAAANKRLTAARDKEADALGRVRIAEIRVNEVRENGRAKTSQIAAAEERLLSARRNAARASQDVRRIEEDINKASSKRIVEDHERTGKSSGKSFLRGFINYMKGDGNREIGQFGQVVGRSFGGGIGSGLEAVLKSPIGPAVLAVMVGVVAAAVPAIGAVLSGGLVGAFGTGLAALPIVFAAKADAVKKKWSDTMGAMGRDMRLLSQPFESTLLAIASIAQRTFNAFRPALQVAFRDLAGPVQDFASDVGRALEQMIPMVVPVARAFDEVLKALGPAMVSALREFSEGMQRVAASVQKNPAAIGDLIEGIGRLLQDFLSILAILNNADGAFKRLTGGVSLVTVVMETLRLIVDTLLTPFVLLGGYISFVSKALSLFKGGAKASGDSMRDAALHVNELAQGLKNTGAAAQGSVPPVKDAKQAALEAKQAAADAAQKYEDWIRSLFRLQEMNLSVAESTLRLKDATARAAAAAKENGKAVSLNTAAGRANYEALVDVARGANAQTEALIRSKTALGTVALNGIRTRESFIKLAVQMGYSTKKAQEMAKNMIAIPNVSRRAVLQANITDLQRKLRTAKASLADKNLTKQRTAAINADIRALQKKLAQAQAQVNALHGKTVNITYKVNGVDFTLNTKTPSSVGRSAAGGKIRGPGGDMSDSAGLWALSNNEWVIRASSSKQYGDKAMDSVNKGTATIIPGLATGGRADVNFIKSGPFASKAQMNAFANQLVGGPALSFARSQAGKPYIWGGVGPRGYDCSGFMSAITNVIQGRNPYTRRFSTGTLPAGLFVRGPGRFEIGWFRGNPGHTAGTLNGVNVESRGGRGVVVGAGARGARDGLFNSGVYHLKGYARGGKVGQGDPPYDGFAQWLMSLKSYKSGTPFVPRDGFAYLHKGERVTPASQNQQRIVLELRTDGTPYMQFLANEIAKYVRGRGGNVQTVLGGRGG